MRILGLGLLISLAACGDGGPPAWNKEPVASVAGSVEGIAYTIDLPKGVELSKHSDAKEQEYQFHHDGRVHAPWVTIRKGYKKQTLAEGKQFDAKSPILHEAESATGWIYAVENSAYKSSEDYIIRAQTYAGDNAIDCSVRIFPPKKGGSAKELIPDAEKICQSLKVK
jgi:hypothetical protein